MVVRQIAVHSFMLVSFYKRINFLYLTCLLQNVDRKYITMLTGSSYFTDYVESILLDERLSLNIDIIYNFLVTFFPQVSKNYK